MAEIANFRVRRAREAKRDQEQVIGFARFQL
jgi:hypothetical protein